MKRFLAFLGNPWVIGFIGVCALGIVIWFGADYVSFGADNTTLSYSTRLITILVIAFLWIIWRLVVMLRTQSQNKELLDGLQTVEKDQGNPEDDRTREELEILSNRFREAMTVLKKSRFSMGNSNKTLYQLPWYIIIGPPGSGKTTALMNSGLQFPLADSGGQASLGGIGGTRHCDWWFTNEAVLIDTSGRYTTQDSHRVVDNAAWTGFLDLLKKYRRRRPINGAMVAISLQDLMLQTEEQRHQHAKIIRARLDELQERLGVQFPVYLTFTKTDLIAGFSEFFTTLSQAEREQVWGMTFELPKDPAGRADLGVFTREYKALITRLNDRVLRLVHQERDIERRSVLQGFPARMDSLHDIINDFLLRAFAENQFNASPMLRGVYFTSGTQEGTPIDRMMSSVTASFGLPREVGRQQVNTGKSYFISRLLNDVIFSESNIVGVNRKFESLLLWARRGVIATLMLVTGVTMAVWAGSVGKNKLLMSDVNGYISDFEINQPTIQRSTESIDALKAMNALQKASTVYKQEEHPWLTSLGLYDGNVDTSANELYDNQLIATFLPAFKHELENQLRGAGSDSGKVMELLQIYLMLINPERRETAMISDWAQKHWEESLPGQATQQQQLTSHLDRLLKHEFGALEGDDRLIARARQQIKSIPVPQRLYSQLKGDEALRGEVDIYSIVGGDTDKVFGVAADSDSFIKPRLFTLAAYEEADYGPDSPLLMELAESRWLYGQTEGEDFSRADREKISEQIKAIYLSEYGQSWQQFSRQFHIAPFKSLRGAASSLKIMADPVYSPLKSVLEAIASNTELTPPVEVPTASSAIRGSSTVNRGAATAGKLLASVRKPTVVDQQFQQIHRYLQSVNGQPSELQGTLALVNELQTFVSDIVHAPDPTEQAFQVTKARFQRSGNDIFKRMRIRAAQSPEPVKSWLTEISDNSWKLLLGNTRAYLNNVWVEQVYSPYQRSLKDRYPLSATQDTEAPLPDFNSFFKPGGIEEKFFNEYLKPFVDTRKWRVKTLDGHAVAISRDTINQLRRATWIRQSFYKDDNSPEVNFQLQPTKLDSNVRLFSLELGDQRLSYSHGPRVTRKFNWDAASSARARIVFEDLNETVNRNQFDGDWSWFRLLEASDIKSTADPREYQLTFNENGREARFRLIAGSSMNPFDQSLLRKYRLSRNL